MHHKLFRNVALETPSVNPTNLSRRMLKGMTMVLTLTPRFPMVVRMVAAAPREQNSSMDDARCHTRKLLHRAEAGMRSPASLPANPWGCPAVIKPITVPGIIPVPVSWSDTKNRINKKY